MSILTSIEFHNQFSILASAALFRFMKTDLFYLFLAVLRTEQFSADLILNLEFYNNLIILIT